jgi:hypothetical protein
MDTIYRAIHRAIAHTITILTPYADAESDWYAHTHRYGDSIGGYYQHSHWYANPHGHTQPRDSATDTAANRYDEWTGIVA